MKGKAEKPTHAESEALSLMALLKINGFEPADEIRRVLYEPGGHEGVRLPRESVLTFIDRFLGGQLSGADLERIAEMIDANERIIISDLDRDDVTAAIFQLSSPEINGALTTERIESIRAELERRHE